MKHYDYIIIGGGLTGDAAVKGIRELDKEGSIGLFSQEPDPPYSRPPLSKGLWKGRPVEKIWRNTQDQGAILHLGSDITKIDPQKKFIEDENGDQYSYDKLLLATGGTPNQLPFGKENIIYYRNFRDYQHVRALSEEKDSFLVIGGGFIGSEIAAALTIVGKKVTMVFPEEAISAHVFPHDLSHYINDYYREKGVEVVPEEMVTSVEKVGDHYSVKTKSGLNFDADAVIAGIGVHPNVELAQQAGLTVENGIVVDEHLMTSAADIYSAGDVANFFHFALGKRKRIEHEDNAIQMGKQAGRNMAGANESYVHVPMFYSDLFKLGYEAVGELSTKLEIVSDWQKPFEKGVVYYLEDGRVRGVLLWNVWDTVPAASELLAQPGPFKPSDLIGKFK